jgi:hypothetical protein
MERIYQYLARIEKETDLMPTWEKRSLWTRLCLLVLNKCFDARQRLEREVVFLRASEKYLRKLCDQLDGQIEQLLASIKSSAEGQE